jgi:hypothetical protein
MRARIKASDTKHTVVVAAHRRHFTHEWVEFPPAFEDEVRRNPYLEIEPEKKGKKIIQPTGDNPPS